MKAILTSLMLAFLFATGAAYAGDGHGDGEGCNYSKKWEDT